MNFVIDQRMKMSIVIKINQPVKMSIVTFRLTRKGIKNNNVTKKLVDFWFLVTLSMEMSMVIVTKYQSSYHFHVLD